MSGLKLKEAIKKAGITQAQALELFSGYNSQESLSRALSNAGEKSKLGWLLALDDSNVIKLIDYAYKNGCSIEEGVNAALTQLFSTNEESLK